MKPNSRKRKSSKPDAPASKVIKTDSDAKELPKKVARAKPQPVKEVKSKKLSKRNVNKEKIHQLKQKIQGGDTDARKELEEIIQKLEAQNNKSKRSKRKLNMYKNILNKKTEEGDVATDQEKPKKKKGAAKAE